MKVLYIFVCPDSNVSFMGGVESWILSMSTALRAVGHTCNIFVLSHEGSLTKTPARWNAKSGSLSDLMRYVAEKLFDIVHIDALNWDSGVCAVRHLPNRPKLMVTHHGATNAAWNSTNCDAIISCSNWGAREQQFWSDIPVYVVHNGVDTAAFKPTSTQAQTITPPVVAWVGRGAAPEKGLINFTQAIPLLKQAGFQVWVADPDGAGKVDAMSERVLSSLADFWQPVPREKMAEFYNKVGLSGGCVVSTSFTEGLPMALLEAQSCGCPVIGPDIAGVKECVSSKSGGVIYKQGIATSEFADLIVSTLKDRAHMARRRFASREEIVNNFSINIMAQKYISIYEQAPSPVKLNIANIKSRYRLSPLLRYSLYKKYRAKAGEVLFKSFLLFDGQKDLRMASVTARTIRDVHPLLLIRRDVLSHYIKFIFSKV